MSSEKFSTLGEVSNTSFSVFLKLARFFLAFFVLCFSFQVRSLLYASPVYVEGEFNFYTTFFIYLADVFLVFALFFWGCVFFSKNSFNKNRVTKKIARHFNWGDKKLTSLILAFLLVLFVAILFSHSQYLSFLLFVRLVEMFLLYLMIVNEVLKADELIKVFLAAIFFQVVLALFQYINQASLGLYFLGEPHLSAFLPGVAKVQLAGQKLLRAYGTFSHPNILGGAIFFSLILAVPFTFSSEIFAKNLKKPRKSLLTLIKFTKGGWGKVILFSAYALLFLALILTFSRSALLALVISAITYFLLTRSKKILKYFSVAGVIFVVAAFVFNLQNIFWQRFVLENDGDATLERLQYLKISWEMLLKNPFGVGLGSFTLNMQQYFDAKLAPWSFQPVHNMFLLVANEGGLIAGLILLVIFIYCFWAMFKRVSLKSGYGLLALLPGLFVIANLDHYFFTIYQGQILFFIYLGLVSIFLKKSGYPLKKS